MGKKGRKEAPDLHFWGVVGRGALYGIAAIPVLAVIGLCIHDHDVRLRVVTLTWGLAIILGPLFVVLGSYFWLCAGALPLRLAHGIESGPGAGMEFMAPVLVRVGVLALVLSPAAYWFTNLVDQASFNSWLFGGY